MSLKDKFSKKTEAPETAASEETLQRQKERQPGFIDKLRVRWKWFDHLLNAHVRYTEQNGRFYAGGITYFSVLSLFPIAMVIFSIIGVVLIKNPELLGDIQSRIVANVPGDMGEKIGELLNAAIKQRGAVGVIGFLTALYSGLAWVGNLRDGITAQWALLPKKTNFFKKKARDLLAMIGLLVFILVSFGISALGSSGLMDDIVRAFYLDHIPGMSNLLQVASLVVSLLAIWLLLFWVIGYLPRERAGRPEAARAALLSAVLLVVWIQVAAFYLKRVLGSPAGAVFGPIIGILVFLFFTWQIILLGAAWAATYPEEIAAIEEKNMEREVERAKDEATAEAKRIAAEREILVKKLEEAKEESVDKA